jgi:uncharacterized protein YndB with AHSA1/START domain
VAGKSSDTAEREIVTTRVFDAPRELVFEAFTNPKHLAQWWGPDGFSLTLHTMEVKPGGSWSFIMHGPDGTDYKNESVFTEVVRPERLAYDHLSGPTFHATVEFEDDGGRTRLTLRMVFETKAARDHTAGKFRAVEGAQQTLERLSQHLPKMQEMLTLTRVYDAPRRRVFGAWSSAKQLAAWWGPNGFTVPECEVDFRAGGKLAICMRSPAGTDHWMRGSFSEVVEPERIVFTVDAGDLDGHLILTIVTFAEEGGKTTLTVRQTVPRNPMMARGQKQGWTEQLERLAKQL